MYRPKTFAPSRPSPLAGNESSAAKPDALARLRALAPSSIISHESRQRLLRQREKDPPDAVPSDAVSPEPLSPLPVPPGAAAPSPHYTKLVPQNFIDKLRLFPLFKNAPKLFHTRIVAQLKLIQHHAQEYIIKKGDRSKLMYWILKGNVAVTLADGESIYAELVSGSYFGEIGILFNRPRTATVVAKTKVLLGVLTLDSLNMVLPEYPAIERRIRDEAQERLAILDKRSKAARTSVFADAGEGYGGARAPLPVTLQAAPRPKRPKTGGGAGGGAASTVSSPPPPPLHPIAASMLSPAIPPPLIPPPDPEGRIDKVDFTILTQTFIKHLPIFGNLPPDIIHQLALGVEPLCFRPFEYIFRKGDIGSDIYFIVAGEVEVIDGASEKCLARLGFGKYFGEMSFLMQLSRQTTGEARRSANVRTVSNCELIVLKHGRLEEICRTYPVLLEEMRRTAGERTALNRGPDRLLIGFVMNKTEPEASTEASTPEATLRSAEAPSEGLEVALEAALAAASAPVSPRAAASGVPTSGAHGPGGRNSVSDPAANAGAFGSASAGAFGLNLSLPPMDPPHPPVNKFRPHPGHFQYLTHLKRQRLASIGGAEKPSRLRLSSIPDLLLLKVLEYLTLPELMKLRPVSRKWRQLLYFAPSLLQTLDLTPWNTLIDDRALICITDFAGSRPTVIDISNCFHVTDEGFLYMINEIGIAGQIRVLRMRSIWEVSAMAIMDLLVPSVGRHLEELDLSNCRKVRDNVVERLLGWAAPPHAYDAAIGCKNLRRLHVGYCKNLTDHVMQHIAVHAHTTLEALDLTRCTAVTDRGFGYWADTEFARLRELSIKDCTFLTDASIRAIARLARHLRHLNLNFCCALSDAAIEMLCAGCPYLQTLDLSFCGSAVSDALLARLARHMRDLERLTIRGCVRVTRAGIDSVLLGCPLLHYIDISQCQNAHIYPGRIPAQRLNVNSLTRLAFVTAGLYQNVIEIVM